jgi:hypothetical protein
VTAQTVASVAGGFWMIAQLDVHYLVTVTEQQ